MPMQPITETMLPAIENELLEIVTRTRESDHDGLYRMLAYHMGWEGEDIGPNARGKRIRPLLVLLTTGATGGEWRRALPAATAVELIHNFSLIHDDIQDNSPLRRGRPTIWKLWGSAQAINAGDAIYTLAQLALLRLEETSNARITIQASQILQNACQKLTQGQYLDIAYELQRGMNLESYWSMIEGKTAALLAACTELGALVGFTEAHIQKAYRSFGYHLGLAFQVRDDFLGIWGDSLITGKSTQSDLISGKKTLPVLYALSKNGPFAKRWEQGAITPDEIPALVTQLEVEGARAFTQERASEITGKALNALQAADVKGEAGEALTNLTEELLTRQV